MSEVTARDAELGAHLSWAGEPDTVQIAPIIHAHLDALQSRIDQETAKLRKLPPGTLTGITGIATGLFVEGTEIVLLLGNVVELAGSLADRFPDWQTFANRLDVLVHEELPAMWQRIEHELLPKLLLAVMERPDEVAAVLEDLARRASTAAVALLGELSGVTPLIERAKATAAAVEASDYERIAEEVTRTTVKAISVLSMLPRSLLKLGSKALGTPLEAVAREIDDVAKRLTSKVKRAPRPKPRNAPHVRTPARSPKSRKRSRGARPAKQAPPRKLSTAQVRRAMQSLSSDAKAWLRSERLEGALERGLARIPEANAKHAHQIVDALNRFHGTGGLNRVVLDLGSNSWQFHEGASFVLRFSGKRFRTLARPKLTLSFEVPQVRGKLGGGRDVASLTRQRRVDIVALQGGKRITFELKSWRITKADLKSGRVRRRLRAQLQTDILYSLEGAGDLRGIEHALARRRWVFELRAATRPTATTRGLAGKAQVKLKVLRNVIVEEALNTPYLRELKKAKQLRELRETLERCVRRMVVYFPT